jgi:uncharacterized protein YjiS (DUF1127 family)
MSAPGTCQVGRAQASAPIAVLRACMRFPHIWIHRLRCRHELSMLTHAQMRDAGLDPINVRREIAKYFWQA